MGVCEGIFTRPPVLYRLSELLSLLCDVERVLLDAINCVDLWDGGGGGYCKTALAWVTLCLLPSEGDTVLKAGMSNRKDITAFSFIIESYAV